MSTVVTKTYRENDLLITQKFEDGTCTHVSIPKNSPHYISPCIEERVPMTKERLSDEYDETYGNWSDRCVHGNHFCSCKCWADLCPDEFCDDKTWEDLHSVKLTCGCRFKYLDICPIGIRQVQQK